MSKYILNNLIIIILKYKNIILTIPLISIPLAQTSLAIRIPTDLLLN
jgi:hypothetical protein